MKYTKEQLLEIYEQEHLKNGLSYSSIREKYDIPRGTWDYYIRIKSEKSADLRKYKANDDFFNAIDSEIKAYLLGFLYADGYLASDGRIGVRLQIDDEEIIKMIQTYICPSSPIVYTNNQNFKRKEQVSIRWKSKIMYKRLQDLGFCINKTKTNSFIFRNIPDEYKWDFLRGYTDGDGHISSYNLDNPTKRKVLISWCNGSVQILKDIMEFLNSYNLHLYDKQTYYVLECSIQKQAFLIIDKLYKNAKFYLERKYNQYLKLNDLYN